MARSKDVNLLREDLQNLPRHVFGVHNNCRPEVCKRKDKNEVNLLEVLEPKLLEEVSKAIDNIKDTCPSYQNSPEERELILLSGPNAEQALPDLPEEEFLRTKKRKLEEIESCTNDI
ncbi:hypothetical protein ILUMI_21755 [Ignelater luminosus]|uniref:Uncharacterized protein n=1 Tax=Ignelater luminosus TaxID=2038154 RepID=A0A8K0FXR1_IGNLU|nr:hypothetical protein ILUMI_21755 [Ignelater luminosus]